VTYLVPKVQNAKKLLLKEEKVLSDDVKAPDQEVQIARRLPLDESKALFKDVTSLVPKVQNAKKLLLKEEKVLSDDVIAPDQEVQIARRLSPKEETTLSKGERVRSKDMKIQGLEVLILRKLLLRE
jgi:hypothetical protein